MQEKLEKDTVFLFSTSNICFHCYFGNETIYKRTFHYKPGGFNHEFDWKFDMQKSYFSTTSWVMHALSSQIIQYIEALSYTALNYTVLSHACTLITDNNTSRTRATRSWTTQFLSHACPLITDNNTLGPWATRPQATQVLQMHDF